MPTETQTDETSDKKVKEKETILIGGAPVTSTSASSNAELAIGEVIKRQQSQTICVQPSVLCFLGSGTPKGRQD